MGFLQGLASEFATVEFSHYLEQIRSMANAQQLEIASSYHRRMKLIYEYYLSERGGVFDRNAWVFTRAPLALLNESIRQLESEQKVSSSLNEQTAIKLCLYSFKAFTWQGFEHEHAPGNRKLMLGSLHRWLVKLGLDGVPWCPESYILSDNY